MRNAKKSLVAKQNKYCLTKWLTRRMPSNFGRIGNQSCHCKRPISFETLGPIEVNKKNHHQKYRGAIEVLI